MLSLDIFLLLYRQIKQLWQFIVTFESRHLKADALKHRQIGKIIDQYCHDNFVQPPSSLIHGGMTPLQEA